MKEQILARITSFYLESGDFNGMPLQALNDEFGRAPVSEHLSGLVTDGLVAIVFGDRHPNPHIRALPDNLSPEEQIAKIGNFNPAHACTYPLPAHLHQRVDRARYAGQPFTLRLALGEPQLVHRAFELSVLENYRNDPRYRYSTDGIQGNISVRDDYFDQGILRRSDEVMLQTFGYCFDAQFNRFVAVYLRYLSGLTPEHQQIWQARELEGPTALHPDYFLMSMGGWPERIPIFQAILAEMRVVNEMAVAIGRPHFFRSEFAGDNRPREFPFLVGPTAREFETFIHVLDRMLSENISRDFFMDEVPYEEEVSHGPGRIEVRQRGTIRILEEWLKARFRAEDTQPITEMINTLREVRRRRQRPAHAINPDEFDQQFVHEQRHLVIRIYDAVRTMRLVLANDPATEAIEIDDLLREGIIRDF